MREIPANKSTHHFAQKQTPIQLDDEAKTKRTGVVF